MQHDIQHRRWFGIGWLLARLSGGVWSLARCCALRGLFLACGLLVGLGGCAIEEPEWTRLRPGDFPAYVSSVDYPEGKRIGEGDSYCFGNWCAAFGDAAPVARGGAEGRYLNFSVEGLVCRNKKKESRNCSLEFSYCFSRRCGGGDFSCRLTVDSVDPGLVPGGTGKIRCPDAIQGKKYLLTVSDDGRLIYFKGDIELGLARDIEAKIQAHPGIEGIALHSDGGHVYEARGVGKVIRKYKLDTYVFAECKSSCTTVFISGANRVVGAQGRLGFHQYKVQNNYHASFINTNAEQERDRVFFEGQDIDSNFLQRVFDAPHSGIWFPTHGELLRFGVVHRVEKNKTVGG